MRWKQNTKTISNHTRLLESLCPAKHSLPPVHSAWKRDFHHLHISCVFQVRKNADDTYTSCSASFSSLLLLRPSCYCLQSPVRGQLVRADKTPFLARPNRRRHITRLRSHCECHWCCQKPPNYTCCTKNRRKRNDLQRCKPVSHLCTSVLFVTSRRTGKSPDDMMTDFAR